LEKKRFVEQDCSIGHPQKIETSWPKLVVIQKGACPQEKKRIHPKTGGGSSSGGKEGTKHVTRVKKKARSKQEGETFFYLIKGTKRAGKESDKELAARFKSRKWRK